MAWPQYRGRLVPWVSWGEWDNVREGLFAAEPEAQQRALGVVSEWRVRGFVPHAVESTAQLVEILLAQAYGGRSGRETQLALSASLVRFVNGVVEPGQKSVRAISVTRLAHLAQLPQWLVELRHGATHSSLPTLPGLQAAAPQALEWLRDSYWQRQRDFVVNSIGACASALEDASRFAAAAARLSRRSSPLSLTSDLVLSASAPHIVISAADKARRSRARQDSKRRRDAKAPAPAPPAPDSGQVADPVSEEEAASRAAVAAGRAQDALSPHGAQDVLVPLLLSPAALYAQYGSLVPPEVLRSGDVSRRCGGNGAVPLPAGATPGAGCFLRGWLVPVASRSLPPTRQGFERLLGRWLPALLAWNSAGGPRADVPLLALCAAARAIGYEQRAAMEARGVDDAGARLFSHRLFFLAWWVRYLLSAHWHTLAAISRHTRAAVGDDTGRKRRAPGQKTGGGGSKGEGGSSGAVALPVRADLDRPTDAASLAPYKRLLARAVRPLREGRTSPWAAAVLAMVDACGEQEEGTEAFQSLAPAFASAETLAYPPPHILRVPAVPEGEAGETAGSSLWQPEARAAAHGGWAQGAPIAGCSAPQPYRGGWPQHVHLMPWAWAGPSAAAYAAYPASAADGGHGAAHWGADAGDTEGPAGPAPHEAAEGAEDGQGAVDPAAPPPAPAPQPAPSGPHGGGDEPRFGWSWSGGAALVDLL